jgi:metal-responsive CopG/Arc/MetJ family transcriptional regulator
MKTIAISIDDSTLEDLDRIARVLQSAERGSPRRRTANRSKVVRAALREYVARHEREQEEQREREVFARNRRKLLRQARALVREQAKP